MTLGMTAVIQGGLVVYSQGVPSGAAAPLLAGFINRPLVFGIPGVLFVWLGIAAIMLFVLRRTAFGFSIYAIGSNERAATLVGLPVSLIRTLLYGLSGLFAGLTGVCVIGYTGTSFISVGDQYGERYSDILSVHHVTGKDRAERDHRADGKIDAFASAEDHKILARRDDAENGGDRQQPHDLRPLCEAGRQQFADQQQED
jgi:hypothetical protein